MQQKCLKSDIYTNEIFLCDSFEQAIDVDFSLPDYCPDISKIFKCNAVPRIASKSINGSTITIDGNVVITILYCDKENNFCSSWSGQPLHLPYIFLSPFRNRLKPA